MDIWQTRGYIKAMIDNNDPVEFPIDGTLDLHIFSPKETQDVVREYIKVCLEKEIYSIRIVHGKGKGVKRRIVHSILDKHPDVDNYHHESGSGGSWGATIVDLKK